MGIIVITSLMVTIFMTRLSDVTANPKPEPLCANFNCPPGKECRLQKDCPTPESCQLKAICVDSSLNTGHRGLCEIGEPVLEPRDGLLLDSFCYNSKPCPTGSYCNTKVMDTYSFCCRSDPTNTTKPGNCPAPTRTDRFFCVDTCGNDGDCNWNDKCCQNGCKKECLMPVPVEPCDDKVCPDGSYCRRQGMPCTSVKTCRAEGECMPCDVPQCRVRCWYGSMKSPNGCNTCDCMPPPPPARPVPAVQPPRPNPMQNRFPSRGFNFYDWLMMNLYGNWIF